MKLLLGLTVGVLLLVVGWEFYQRVDDSEVEFKSLLSRLKRQKESK